jgi:hypothetical protein
LLEEASTWEIKGFSSHKQFFFLKCSDIGEPYPYTQEQMNGFVKAAVEIFSDEEINYEDVHYRIFEQVKDNDLTDELYGFIPELCGGMAYEINTPDMFLIGTERNGNKWQITAYHMIERALNIGFGNNLFPEKSFGRCASVGSIHNCICQIKEKDPDTDLSNIRLAISFGFDDDYKIR